MDSFNKIDRTLLGKTALCAALLLSAVAGTASQAADLARADRRFMDQAAQAGMFEIAASRLAADHSGNEDLKQYAQMMITDHTAVAQDLQALASSKGVQLPANPSRSQQSLLGQLRNAKNAKFDKTYAEKVAVSAHRDAVKLFTNAVKNAKDADVKAFAEKNLPTLKAHLEQGRKVRSEVSGSRPGGWVGEHPSNPSNPASPSNPGSAPAPATPSQTTPAAPVSPVSPASPAAPANVVPGK